MELLECTAYIAILGIVSNLLGNLLPRCWFRDDRFPYRCFSWEKGGSIYLKLHIRVWKDKLPDMSKITRHMYRKEVSKKPNAENLHRLIQETCVAEFVHAVLLILSLHVTQIWQGTWGWFFYGLCILGNLPFIIIQRFNRPRLQKALARMTKTC